MPPNTIGKGIVEVGYDKDQAEKSARDSILPGLNRVAGDMAGVFAGKKIFDFAKQGFAELGEAEKVAALTTSTIKATGGAANVTADDVAGLAGKLSDLSGKDDELIQSGANLLLTFKGVRNEVGDGNDIFDQATTAALNLSTAGFGSMETASLMLGKALNDPVAGITALSRAGVTFTEDQKATIKSLADTGDLLGAQKIILGEVEAQVGGAAEAYGQTLPGQLERAKTSMDNTKAAMVSGLAPALEVGAQLATAAATKFQELPEPLQQVIGATALLGGGFAAMARPVNDAINLIRTLRGAHETAAVAAGVQAAAEGSAAVAAEAVTVATVAETAALEAEATAAGLSLLATVGLVAAPLALGAAFAYGVTHAEDFSLSLQGVENPAAKVTDNMRALEEAARLTGKSTYDVAKQLAEQSIPAALAYADGLDRDGKSSDDARRAIDDQRVAADKAKTTMEQYTKVADADAETQKNLAAQLDAAKEAMDRQRAAMDSLIGSNIAVAEAERGTEDALNKVLVAQGKANEAQGIDALVAQDKLKGAVLDAASAVDRQAQAIADNSAKQDEANGHAQTAAEKSDHYRDALQRLTDDLAPDSPVRVQLQQWIDQLNEIPAEKSTRISVSTPGGLPAATAGGRPSFDVGGFVPGPIGAPLAAIVHGGEYVISNDELAGLQSGIAAGSSPVGGASGVHIDQVNVTGQSALDALTDLPDALRSSAYLAGVG